MDPSDSMCVFYCGDWVYGRAFHVLYGKDPVTAVILLVLVVAAVCAISYMVGALQAPSWRPHVPYEPPRFDEDGQYRDPR